MKAEVVTTMAAQNIFTVPPGMTKLPRRLLACGREKCQQSVRSL
jgi:hypothetical protein